MKRTALLAVLLVAYGAFFGRRLISTGSIPVDPVGPEARQIEQAIANGQFAEAQSLVQSVHSRVGREPLTMYWTALIARGLKRPGEEVQSWEDLAGADAREVCPDLANAYARLGDNQQTISAYARCVSADRDNPERLIDLGDAYERAGRMADALTTFQKAAALDPTNPVIGRRIERLTERLKRQRR